METMRLFCPLAADVDSKQTSRSYLDRKILPQDELTAYSGAINGALEKHQQMPDYKESLVQPLHDVGISVIDKIHSRSIGVEENSGKLWGIASFEITEALTPDETEALKILWEGEIADGFGLELATTGIPTDRGDLYLSFWEHGENYFIDTEREFLQRLGRDELLAQIAKKHCRFETLETRNRDSLDFREVSVWGLKEALEEAFAAGATQQMERHKDAAHDTARNDSGEKPSVMDRIREAARAPKEPSKNKIARDKSGPEL